MTDYAAEVENILHQVVPVQMEGSTFDGAVRLFAALLERLCGEARSEPDPQVAELLHDAMAKQEAAEDQLIKAREEIERLAGNWQGHPSMCCGQCHDAIAKAEAQLSEARAEVERLWRTINGQTKELADWSTRAEKAEAALESLKAKTRAFVVWFLNWAAKQDLSPEGRAYIEKYRADLAEVDAQAIRGEGER